METSKQIVKVTKSLTTARECRNHAKLLMQPYANWEEYLTPAPMSIAILAELIFISSNTDFSIRKGGPSDGFKYIKYPDSFRACLMQVCNAGWRAFNDAHKNMDQIRLYTNNVPIYIKRAVRILLQGDDNVMQVMLPGELDNIRNIADDCVNLAQSTEKRFTDVIELIQELLETCTSAKQVYGSELEEVRKKIRENELRKKLAEEANKMAQEAFKNLDKQLQKAQESFDKSLNSMPSGWEMIGLDFVEGLLNGVTVAVSGMASMVAAPVAIPTMITNCAIRETFGKANENNDQISKTNIYSTSPVILSSVKSLGAFFHEDQIKWHELIDQKTKTPKTNSLKDQFVIVQELIKNEKECEPKTEAMKLCIKAITICSELENFKPEEEPDDAKTKKIVELMKTLTIESMTFDTKSKSATNTPAFSIKQPQISQTQENSSGSKSARQKTADTARLKIEQTKDQLEKAQKLYEMGVDNVEKKKRELTEFLITLRNCEVKKIDFNTTIRILSQGLEAMGNVKDQWQKLVRFFQMVSNLIKTCLDTSLKDFAKTTDSASQIMTYSSRMFLKDVIYNQAFFASSIASLVNMIAATYTEVSDKYLMDGVSRLSKLMSLDVTKPEFLNERRFMEDSCNQAEEGIRNLVKKNKRDFEMKSKQRMEKIESELKAVLPPESEEKKRETREAVENASEKDEDMNHFA